MCLWRELALEHLPGLRELIITATSHTDLWQNFKELLSDDGLKESKQAEVKSIYDYAWWCVADSGDEDLAEEVKVFFYEDLPMYSDFADQGALYISPSQYDQLDSSFRYLLTEEEYADFCSRYFAKRGEQWSKGKE